MVESNELQSMIPSKKAANSNAGSLEHRMKELINQAKVMVFMKGNRNEPRCGFSRTLMEILKGKKNESLQLKPRQILGNEIRLKFNSDFFLHFQKQKWSFQPSIFCPTKTFDRVLKSSLTGRRIHKFMFKANLLEDSTSLRN